MTEDWQISDEKTEYSIDDMLNSEKTFINTMLSSYKNELIKAKNKPRIKTEIEKKIKLWEKNKKLNDQGLDYMTGKPHVLTEPEPEPIFLSKPADEQTLEFIKKYPNMISSYARGILRSMDKDEIVHAESINNRIEKYHMKFNPAYIHNSYYTLAAIRECFNAGMIEQSEKWITSLSVNPESVSGTDHQKPKRGDTIGYSYRLTDFGNKIKELIL